MLASIPDELEIWPITLAPDGTGGSADHTTRTIHVGYDPTWPRAYVRYYVLHELGHAHDEDYLTDDEREQWKQERGIEVEGWFYYSGPDDYDVPAGDFAESFAECNDSPYETPDEWFLSRLGPPPDADDCQLMKELVA